MTIYLCCLPTYDCLKDSFDLLVLPMPYSIPPSPPHRPHCVPPPVLKVASTTIHLSTSALFRALPMTIVTMTMTIVGKTSSAEEMFKMENLELRLFQLCLQLLYRLPIAHFTTVRIIFEARRR